MKKGLLGRIRENRAQEVNEDILPHQEQLTQFDFEGKSYYVTVRDNVLIFDANMMLIHTVKKEEIVMSDVPLFQKVNQVTLNKDEPEVKLFVKRNGSFETLSFYNSFDAIFIFKKLKRVASRPDENIEELLIEENGKVVDHFVTRAQRRIGKRFNRRNRESQQVNKLVEVEETLENVISEGVNNPDAELDSEKIEKCIELLEDLKPQAESEE